MDIKLQSEGINFHYCARAIIKQDEKILILRVNDAAYYHLPGGHVEIGETSKQALLREIKEETGFEITIEKLAVVNEQFYHKKGATNHSVIFYYVAKPVSKIKVENTVHIEQGKTKLIKNELRWVSIAELKDIDLRPALIKELILKDKCETLQHFIG